MTDSGQENAGNSREEIDEETTHIARQDSTRPMPAQPESSEPRSSWSGSASGSTGSSPLGAQGAGPDQGSHYPSAPPQGNPQAAGPQGPGPQQGQGGWSVPPQGGNPYSAGPYASQPNPYGPPQPNPQQGFGAQPFGGQSGYQQPGYPSAPPYGGGQYGAPTGGSPYGPPAPQGPPSQGSPQYQSGYPGAQYPSNPQTAASSGPYQSNQYGSNPFGGSPYSAAPYGQPSTGSKPAGVVHQLTPLEKFSPFVPAFLILIAAFLTWATFKSGPQTVSLNGIGGNSNSSNPNLGGAKSTGGWLSIVLALGLVGAAVAAILGKLKGTIVAVATIVLSALAFVIALIQFANVHSIVNGSAGRGYSGTIGIGVWLTLFGALVGIALGITAFLSARKRESARG